MCPGVRFPEPLSPLARRALARRRGAISALAAAASRRAAPETALDSYVTCRLRYVYKSPTEERTMRQEIKYQRRWKTLAVLSLSLVVIGLDNTVLNVALPTLQREFTATGSQLQWMVDAYVLVFAGLLLPLGALGDRVGRARALAAGLALFGLASAAAALAGSSGELIAARAAMGVGGALIMPATLSIITDVFPEDERGKAIGVWAGMAAVGIGLGPLIGGALLEWTTWEWVFLLNVPVVLVALALGSVLVPDSRDEDPGAVDVLGSALSVGALVSLVYALIEAPGRGWTDAVVLAGFGAAIVLGGAFVAWERHTGSPLLDVSLFRRAAFSFGSLAVSATFFALFGTIFVLTQYLQFVQGASPLEAGLKLAPLALGLVLAASNSDRLVQRFGAPRVISTGMLGVAASLLAVLLWESGTGYWALLVFILGLALSMGNVMAPATDSVMAAVPRAKAGVGSAMNDVNRMVAGALGVAVIGSLASSAYTTRVEEATAALPPGAAEVANESVGGASAVAARLPDGLGDALVATAGGAFTDAMGIALTVGAVVLFLAALAVRRLLPDRRHVAAPAAAAAAIGHSA